MSGAAVDQNVSGSGNNDSRVARCRCAASELAGERVMNTAAAKKNEKTAQQGDRALLCGRTRERRK